MWHIYSVEYYSAIKKNESMSFTEQWTELEIIMLSEISQRERQISHGLSYVESRKKNGIEAGKN
jgi:hypothetical protein